MNLIVAVDKHWAIGQKGQLLITIPGDQKLFREETRGKIIVMGRTTLESLPGGQPLPGRVNVVLTKNKDLKIKDAVVCHDLAATLDVLKGYPEESIYIIGGQTIYEQFLPYCKVAHITYIDYEYDADTYFPNLDQASDWQLMAESDEQTYADLCYEFRMYVRRDC